MLSALPRKMKRARRKRELTCQGTDGTGHDHDGRDGRDVTISCVVVVAIVPRLVSRPSLSTAHSSRR